MPAASLLTAAARAAQRLAKQLGVPGGGKGSRKQLVERLCEFNRCAPRPRPLAPTELRTGYSLAVIAGRLPRRENEQALEEDPERWPERGSNFNLVPVNIEVKHAAATRGGAAASGGAAAGGAAAGGGAAAAAAGLSVEVPSSLRDNTTALISPLVPKGPGAASNKRKRDGAQPMRPASALRKKSKYSPSNKEYLERIETTASDSTALQNADTSPSAAAQRHRESPAINFSPFNRVNLIPAKEEYDEYRAEFADEPEVKTLFA